jgi:hypothetical protein
MRRLIGYGAKALAVLVLIAASTPFPPSRAEALPCSDAAVRATPSAAIPLAQNPPAKCCFTNPGYAGTCEVEPAKDESCGAILGYLNNPMSQGKGYCGNTTLRGGWQSVVCEPKK